MKEVKEILKNWWFTLLGVLLVIADQGFDFINPILIAVGCPANWMAIIKSAFVIYGIIKLKTDLPSRSLDKLQFLISKKIK